MEENQPAAGQGRGGYTKVSALRRCQLLVNITTKVNFREESEGGQRGSFVIACRELLPNVRTNVMKKRRYLFHNLAIDYGSL